MTFHVAVFAVKHNQDAGQNALKDLGVEFEEFPMGRTLIKGMDETTFAVWIKPYQDHDDSGIDLCPLQDLGFYEDEQEARAACNWRHFDPEESFSV